MMCHIHRVVINSKTMFDININYKQLKLGHCIPDVFPSVSKE